MAPFRHSCVSGQAGEETARSCLHADVIPCAEPAPAAACHLEKYFHPSVLTGGDHVLWIRRDNSFLSFRLHGFICIIQLSLKHDCLSDGAFARIGMSARQGQPSACPQARGILAKRTFDLTQERISCIFKAASHPSCLKPFV